jgi:hypothetical protein
VTRRLIGPAWAHRDAPCTDACYEDVSEGNWPHDESEMIYLDGPSFDPAEVERIHDLWVQKARTPQGKGITDYGWFCEGWEARSEEVKDLRERVQAYMRMYPCKCDPPGSGEEFCTGACEPPYECEDCGGPLPTHAVTCITGAGL